MMAETKIFALADNIELSEVIELLHEHSKDMEEFSPPGTCHYLDLSALKDPLVSFWSFWTSTPHSSNNTNEYNLIGCGALRIIDTTTIELKSMRVNSAKRGQGIGSMVLDFLIYQATRKGYSVIKLETGSDEYFVPAVKLYKKHGFKICDAFADYPVTDFNVYLEKKVAKNQLDQIQHNAKKVLDLALSDCGTRFIINSPIESAL